eukprot:CAMPEP_0196574328 /NCGR_PEP_ID=MMETSP1081-20130531/4062_1 /TAXON_ID=36882 /ORGANISM="Pyramimonas amylifera, Strain CCMP720" /LENGTH=271 /DNA_ID=CAMNT_0041892319 /DNA_START=91 /DNA_END=906 /DNA_ORIENTATION=-
MASMVISAALAVLDVFTLYKIAETDLTPAEKVPAYFMESRWECPAIGTACYLLFCFFGKKYMQGREKAFDMKGPMLVYNFYQTCFNIACIYFCVTAHRAQGLNIVGNPVNFGAESFGISQFIWLHYNNKYIELLDTFFMVARKKFDQMSFLHIYHHTLLIWSWFVVMKIAPVCDSYFGALANTTIHVIMYSYYFLSACGIQCFWKKYITQAQMLQFVIVASQSFAVMYLGTVDPVLSWLQLFVMVNMFVLFANFYRQSYAKKAKARQAKAQ